MVQRQSASSIANWKVANRKLGKKLKKERGRPKKIGLNFFRLSTRSHRTPQPCHRTPRRSHPERGLIVARQAQRSTAVEGSLPCLDLRTPRHSHGAHRRRDHPQPAGHPERSRFSGGAKDLPLHCTLTKTSAAESKAPQPPTMYSVRRGHTHAE